MPIYEYVCETCGEDFEILQKFSDKPLKRHTCAPKSVVRRKLSLNAFQLKGGGWYSEGYAKETKEKGSSDNGKPGSAAAADNGSGKSDSSAGKCDSKSTTTSSKSGSSSASSST